MRSVAGQRSRIHHEVASSRDSDYGGCNRDICQTINQRHSECLGPRLLSRSRCRFRTLCRCALRRDARTKAGGKGTIFGRTKHSHFFRVLAKSVCTCTFSQSRVRQRLFHGAFIYPRNLCICTYGNSPARGRLIGSNAKHQGADNCFVRWYYGQ